MSTNGEHTIESGLEVLRGRAEFHRKEADRFDRLVSAMQEASTLLHTSPSTNGIKSVGRPKNEDERKVILNAIEAMPHEFGLKELKEAASEIDIDVFRRLFRDIKSSGVVKVLVEATGRRDGRYQKNDKAASS